MSLLLSYNVLQAQVKRYPVNIYWLSAAQYDPGLTTPASFAVNPSVNTSMKGFSCSIYSEKKFMLEGLNLLVFSCMTARSESAGGVNFQYFGNPAYNEMQAGINYGKSLGKINIGVAINYSVTGVAGMKKQTAINTCFATTWKLLDNIYTSVQLINPSVLQGGGKGGAPAYKLGLGYKPSSNTYTGFEVIKEEDKPPQVLVVLHYYVSRKFFTRIGFNTGLAQVYFGIGWKLKDFGIEAITSHHAVLGFSPAILFTYHNDVEN